MRKTWFDYANDTTLRAHVLEVRIPSHVEAPPIAHVLVERQEMNMRAPPAATLDAPVESAWIRLWYTRLPLPIVRRDLAQLYFEGNYSKAMNTVALTSGAVFLDLPDLRGHRIGTYLMNEIVRWAKRWPDAEVKPVRLLSGQADRENKERRNHFYERFGLGFDYTDSDRREGESRAMKARELVEVESWKQNIRECALEDFLTHQLLQQGDMAHTLRRYREREARWTAAYERRSRLKTLAWKLLLLVLLGSSVAATAARLSSCSEHSAQSASPTDQP